MLKLGKLNINNAYLGRTGVQKMYLGADLVWGGEEPDCYAIANTVAEYTGDYPWLWVDSEQKWYIRNEQNTYEPYGVYASSIEPFWYHEEPLLEATFAAESYYVTDKNASGNTRMVIDFTTPDVWGAGTQFLCGTRTGTTATYMTNVGYTNAGKLRIDAGSNTFATDTYDLTVGTRYILDYRTYGTNLRWILSTPDGTVLRDFSTTFTGSQVSNYPFCINTMNQGGNPLAAYAKDGSKIRSVKFYSIDSVNDEGTLTNDYRFIWNVCIDKVTNHNPTKVGTVSFTETGEKYLIPVGETTYKGKLAIVDGLEYEWDGSKWVDVEKTTYDVCTAILDGKSYFDSEATMGYPRRYTYIFKPKSDGVSTNFIAGVRKDGNHQSIYLENYNGGGLKYTFGHGDEYTATTSGNTKMNVWTKIVTNTHYRTSSYRDFSVVYHTGDTYDTQAWVSVQSLSDTTDKTANSSLTVGIGGVGIGSSTSPGMIGEFHSALIQDAENATSTSPTWRTYKDLVFVDVDGEIKMYDKVSGKFFSNFGTGTATKGIVYDSLSMYKEYEPKEAPENPMVFDTVAEMEAYGCVFEGMNAAVGNDVFKYINGQWVLLDFSTAIKYTTTDKQPLSNILPGGINVMLDDTGYYFFNTPIEIIPANTFKGATTLKTIEFPDSVITIGDYSLGQCTNLTSVKLPNSVTTISGSAFRQSTKLASITIPSSVIEMGGYVFEGCTALTSITIPDSVISLLDYSFSGCTNLTKATLGNSLTTIAPSLFRGCSKLTGITVGNSVTSIGNYAFSTCTALTGITIPDSVTSIGTYAFNGCTGLTSVRIGNSVTSIDTYAFNGCTKLASITIPDSVTSIGTGAFNSCSSLARIEIGSRLGSIGNSAFYECTKLSAITINAVTAPTLGSNVFFHPVEYGTLIYPEGSDYSTWLANSTGRLGYYNWNPPEAECYPASCNKYLVTTASTKQYYSAPKGETTITDCKYNLAGLKTWTARVGDFTTFSGVSPAFGTNMVTENYGTAYTTCELIDITIPNTLTIFTYPWGRDGNKATALKRITFRNFGVVKQYINAQASLPKLEYYSIDTLNLTSTSAFVSASMTSLTEFYVDRITDSANRTLNAPNLTYDSLMRIINALDSTTNSRTLTIGATNLAKLTEEDIAIATNKGWIVQ